MNNKVVMEDLKEDLKLNKEVKKGLKDLKEDLKLNKEVKEGLEDLKEDLKLNKVDLEDHLVFMDHMEAIKVVGKMNQ